MVYINVDIATRKAEPLSEGNLNELLSMLGIGPYVGVLIQPIPVSSRPRITSPIMECAPFFHPRHAC